jgi:hypothetical protein
MMLPGSAGLTWVIEAPISTEGHLLDHTGNQFRDHKANESSLNMTVTPSQPGEGTRSPFPWACSWQVPTSQPPNPVRPVHQQQVIREALTFPESKANIVQ